MTDTTTQADIQALRAELKVLRADFAKIAELLGDAARHGGAEAADKIRASAERGWAEAKSTGERLIKEMEERPVGSALSIFGVGLVLGLLFGRR